MKYLYLVLTLMIQFICVREFKLFDNMYLIFIIFIVTLLSGLGMYNSKSKTFKDLGWGLLFGSLSSIALIFVFMIWLSFNYPK